MGVIKAVHPRINLISLIAQEVLERNFNDVKVLFPHRRPKVYLLKELHERIKKAFVPPKIFTFTDLINEMAIEAENPPKTPISTLDQVWIVYEKVKAAKNRLKSYSALSDKWNSFLPWGLMLVRLIDEAEKEMIDAEDIRDYLYPEGISKEAAVLVENFSFIYREYLEFLEKNNLTTEAHRQNNLAKRVEEGKINLRGFIAAGFYALTKSEEIIFKNIYDNEGIIFWQADPDNLPPLYERWKKSWKINVEYVNCESKTETEITYYKASNLHSEIEIVKTILEETEIASPHDVAVVLADPEALLPLIYSVDMEKYKANISMGFPLKNTLLFSLFEQLTKLCESSHRNSLHYKEVVDFLEHPLVQRLFFKSNFVPTEIANRIKRDFIQENMVFVCVDALGLSSELKSILEKALKTSTLKEAAELLECVSDMIIKSEKTSEIEKEAALLLKIKIIPEIKSSIWAEKPVGREAALHGLLHYMKQLSIPFEGEPLEGLQIIGLLETRTINFKNIIVIDANEGILPSSEELNPVLPERIKEALGLPHRERKEKITQYHFERLIKSATKAHILYQEAVQAALEQKKVRSRFVEKLIWEEEKRKKRILEGERVKTFEVKIETTEAKKEWIEKTEEDLSKIRNILSKELSFSMIDTYINCPARFYFKYVLEIEEPPERKDFDATGMGKAVHKILEDYFSPFKGRVYKKEYYNETRLEELIDKHLEDLFRKTDPVRRKFLEEACRFRLRNFLKSHPKEPVVIKELEVKLSSEISGYKFTAIIDRVDEKNDLIYIFDYKTGGINTRFSLNEPENMEKIFANPPNLQLFIYMHIYSKEKKIEPERLRAAFLLLSEAGRKEIEREIFKAKEKSIRETINENLPELIKNIISDMLSRENFPKTANPRNCKWCAYREICYVRN